MKIKNLFHLIVVFPIVALAETENLIRFVNGDQLHGQYQGVSDDGSIIWKHNQAEEQTIHFDAEDIRQIILKPEKSGKSINSFSYIGTINGDKIPCVVKEADETRVIVQSQIVGEIELPRDQVGIIAPNPVGGRVLYYGPFYKEEWTQRNIQNIKGIPMDESAEENAKKFPLWDFSGSAWYWNNAHLGAALTRDTGMMDRSILQFEVAWKNRLSLAVVFHADFEIDNNADALDHDAHYTKLTDAPYIFGSSYVLYMNSGVFSIYSTGFDDNGKPTMLRPKLIDYSLPKLPNTGTAKIEIRCNRDSGDIIVMIDGKTAYSWKEAAPDTKDSISYRGKGDGYGFFVHVEDSPIRISDVIVAEWNGIPDSAKSLESNESDIVLLNNGTDRFSGKITTIKDGKANLAGRYGKFAFPINDIAEIRFAKSSLKTPNEDAHNELKVRFQPVGTISGKILSADAASIKLSHSAAGAINIKLDSANMLEFNSIQSYLDDWNVEF